VPPADAPPVPVVDCIAGAYRLTVCYGGTVWRGWTVWPGWTFV